MSPEPLLRTTHHLRVIVNILCIFYNFPTALKIKTKMKKQ